MTIEAREALTAAVRERYARAAQQAGSGRPSSCCGEDGSCQSDPITRDLYRADELTGLPAEVFRLPDRGVLCAGAFADIAVFDPTRVRDTATYEDPHQLAQGMVHVLVNGRLAVEDGSPTGARAGTVLTR